MHVITKKDEAEMRQHQSNYPVMPVDPIPNISLHLLWVHGNAVGFQTVTDFLQVFVNLVEVRLRWP